MSHVGGIWNLHAGDERIASLVVTDTEFPWLHARVEPDPAFERFRALFDEEAAASEAEDWNRADALYERIRKELRLENPDGKDVPEFLLHIERGVAWWRYSDEPFG